MMDLHIHIRDVLDNTSSIDDFFVNLKKYNINEICFLEHSKRISDKHNGYLIDTISYKKLIKTIELAKSKYSSFNIYSGIEVDYSINEEFRNKILKYLQEHKFDYVIGSIHSINFTTPKEYYDLVIDMINNYPINIIGHLKMFDDWKNNIGYLTKIIDLCREKKIKIEVNTSDRSIWTKEQFFFMLNIMNENGVDYTIGSDAHNKNQIGKNYELIKNRLQGEKNL